MTALERELAGIKMMLAEIVRRLDRIEQQRAAGVLAVEDPAVRAHTEMATAIANGHDLAQYLKERARLAMQRERCRARRSKQ